MVSTVLLCSIQKLFGFYFKFSCRRGMKASVATTADLSAQRSILFEMPRIVAYT